MTLILDVQINYVEGFAVSDDLNQFENKIYVSEILPFICTSEI